MTDTHSAVVAAEGHLVDSQQLKAIFDKVIERGGAFEVQHFQLGRTNDEVLAADAEGGGAKCSRAGGSPRGAPAIRLPCGRRAGCHRARDGEGRLRAGRLLLHDQPADRRPGRWCLARSRTSAHGCRRRAGVGPRGVPETPRGPRRRSRRVRTRRHPRPARVPGPDQGRFRVHDERDLLREARRSERRTHRRDDAAHPSAWAEDCLRRRTRRRPHRRRRVLHRADPARLRGRPALWQCPGGARRGAIIVRHVARRGPRGGHAGSGRSPPSYARHQCHQRGRRNRRRRRVRRPEKRSDGRVRSRRVSATSLQAASATTVPLSIR